MKRRSGLIQGDITRLRWTPSSTPPTTPCWEEEGWTGPSTRAAGPRLVAEVRHPWRVPHRRRKNNRGYKLPARHVIHTVGPVRHGGGKGEPDLLRSAYRRCFQVAHENGIASIAFPAISAGDTATPWTRHARSPCPRPGRAGEYPELERVVFVPFSASAPSHLPGDLRQDISLTGGPLTVRIPDFQGPAPLFFIRRSLFLTAAPLPDMVCSGD